MKAARPTSPRLSRVVALLEDGAWHTTRDIVVNAECMAVSSAISELRQHGAVIACEARPVRSRPGQPMVKRYCYRMTKGPADA